METGEQLDHTVRITGQHEWRVSLHGLGGSVWGTDMRLKLT